MGPTCLTSVQPAERSRRRKPISKKKEANQLFLKVFFFQCQPRKEGERRDNEKSEKKEEEKEGRSEFLLPNDLAACIG